MSWERFLMRGKGINGGTYFYPVAMNTVVRCFVSVLRAGEPLAAGAGDSSRPGAEIGGRA